MTEVASKGSAAGTKGLEGIIAANSEICFIDGKEGRLLYEGYNIHELAEKSSFEEVCYLLWHGRLPNRAELRLKDVDRVIGWTFAIGGLLAGAASVIYGLTINTVSFQMGYQNGLYAFTAAVLGGIGNLPGAMLGGIVIGLVRSLGSQYVGEQWTSALVFGVLILLLIFRPSGLLGTRTREKV